MARPDLTPAEERLVDEYVSVLDFVSRCAQAVDEGNTYYLWDKAGQLREAVDRLVRELDQASGKLKVRANLVAAAVRYHGRHYRAGRLLHPARVELTPSEVGSILLDVAGVVGITAGVAELERIAGDATGIAERADVRPDQVARVLCALKAWEVRDAE